MEANSDNGAVDLELELAIQLSKQSYEDELRRRRLANEDEDLINLEDIETKRRQEQIQDITQLFETNRERNPSSLAPSCIPTSSSAPSWSTFLCKQSSLPTIHCQNNNIYLKTTANNNTFAKPLFNQQLSMETFPWQNIYPSFQEHRKKLGVSQQPLQSVQSSSLCNTSLIVPFQPLSTRLINGDLIDLGNETVKGLESPLNYDQIREEFDPLCRVSFNDAPKSSAKESASLSSNTLLWRSPENSPPLLQRSQSVTATNLEKPTFAKPGRPPPPKPPRLRPSSGRSGSVDAKTRSCPPGNIQEFPIENLCLQSKVCEVDEEISLLKRRKPVKQGAQALRFISPVVDYLITNFKVTSVKVIVEKDYSWPGNANPVENKMTFTCETKSTIQEILANVLNTFLEPKKIEECNGCLPIEEYGLKIFGLDEFLLNSSQLGENPFVGEALAFGRDIRLEVGRVDGLLLYKTIQELDLSNIGDTALAASKSHSDENVYFDTTKVETVQEIIDAFKKNVECCATSATFEDASKSRNAVGQTVKLLCTVLGRIMNSDLFSALRAYFAASTADELASSASKLIYAVYQFIGAFCNSSRCNFDVVPLKDERRDRREIVSMDEHLLVHVDSIHNIPNDWINHYHAFYIAIHVMHGTAELCRGFREAPKPMISDATFPYCRINAWANFDLPLCILPRETRIFVLLYGVATSCDEQSDLNSGSSVTVTPEDSPNFTEKQLACASFPVFNYEKFAFDDCGINLFMRQGPLLLPLSLIEGSVVQPWGPRPIFETQGVLTAIVMLPRFSYDVVFPHVGFGETSLKREFQSLDVDTRQSLMDIIEGGVTHSLSQDEKEILWEKRYYLTQLPEALTLVLASAVGWDWASLNNIYQMVDDWTPLDPVQAVELLLPHFPDLIIREKAIERLKGASTDFLFNFLPELVEALRFETFENSSLALYLLSLSAEDRRFAFELYWQLQQRIDHSIERWFIYRCKILQKQMLEIADEVLRMDIKNQRRLLRALTAIAAEVKEGGEQTKSLAILRRNLSLLDGNILENNVRLPILPSFLCAGINVSECSFFNSLTKPLKLSFKGLKTSYGVLFKVGDDVRQDSLVLQLVKMMNDIWLSQELDLRMIVFRCMPVGNKIGLIELVPDCRTLCEIQSALGATGVFKDDVLKNWLEKYNPTEFQYKIALENFQLSCAGWCVATYVLGIGDRHNDNILMTKTGHVFHIDFGKYMGDWQMAAGFRRDRTPFIFTAEMAYVINGGSSQSATGYYQQFVDSCCKAFNMLRRKYSLLVNLIKMMSCSGIPGMGMEAVSFVQNNLMLHLSDTEATVQFTRMIQESLKSKYPRLNFFAHTLVQLKNTSSMIRGSYDDPNKLSFVPELYEERTDGKITGVVVLGFEKWRTPDKVYMYRLRVERLNEAVSTTVYRSFDEFTELYIKLCRRFPIARLPPLSRGTGVGRSNIRSVAERRRTEIQQFLNLLYEHHREVAHCDLVYTFFHIIFRDSVPEESNRLSQPSCKFFFSLQATFQWLQSEAQVTNSITGRIFLRISFNPQKSILSIFVGHVKDLKAINGQPPDSYVKTYLHPRMQRSTKRKTRVIKNTQTPTFNEELNYQMGNNPRLNDRALEVSVWNCRSIVGENSMIGTIHIPLRLLNEVRVDRKGVRTLENWFQLNG